MFATDVDALSSAAASRGEFWFVVARRWRQKQMDMTWYNETTNNAEPMAIRRITTLSDRGLSPLSSAINQWMCDAIERKKW